MPTKYSEFENGLKETLTDHLQAIKDESEVLNEQVKTAVTRSEQIVVESMRIIAALKALKQTRKSA